MTAWEYVKVFAILVGFAGLCVWMVCSLNAHHDRLLRELDEDIEAREFAERRDRWAA